MMQGTLLSIGERTWKGIDMCTCITESLCHTPESTTISLINHLCVHAQLLSHVWLFATPWTVAHQAPLSTRSPRQNTGVGYHFLLQGIFPTRDRTHVSCTDRWILYHWATWEVRFSTEYTLNCQWLFQGQEQNILRTFILETMETQVLQIRGL